MIARMPHSFIDHTTFKKIDQHLEIHANHALSVIKLVMKYSLVIEIKRIVIEAVTIVRSIRLFGFCNYSRASNKKPLLLLLR